MKTIKTKAYKKVLEMLKMVQHNRCQAVLVGKNNHEIYIGKVLSVVPIERSGVAIEMFVEKTYITIRVSHDDVMNNLTIKNI